MQSTLQAYIDSVDDDTSYHSNAFALVSTSLGIRSRGRGIGLLNTHRAARHPSPI